MAPEEQVTKRGNSHCLPQFEAMIKCVERTGCANDCHHKVKAFLSCDRAAFKSAERAAYRAGRGMSAVGGDVGDGEDTTQAVVVEVDLSPFQRSFARQWDAYGQLADDIRNAAKVDRVGNFLGSMVDDMRRTALAAGAWVVRFFDRNR